VRDREKLAALSPGGSRERPIGIPSAAVVDTRVRNAQCPQCTGEYKLVEHRSAGPGLREVEVRCVMCGTPRTLWFRIVPDEPN
jgi:predicted Zn finger-like uncharacterized protein